jgi:GNAT superfamily N-acetyltransferase
MFIDYRAFLQPTDPALTLHEVAHGDLTHFQELGDILTEMMPQYAHYLGRIHAIAQHPPDFEPGFVHRQWLARLNGQPAGIIVFKSVLARGCGLGLDFAILPPYRTLELSGGRRLAKFLLEMCLRQLTADADAHGRPHPMGLLVEVEPENGHRDPQGRLLQQYRKYGFVDLTVHYVEPPFIVQSADDEARLTAGSFHPMRLGIFPNTGITADHLHQPATLRHLVQAFLVDHYRLPPTHWAVQQALDSVGSD